MKIEHPLCLKMMETVVETERLTIYGDHQGETENFWILMAKIQQQFLSYQ